MVLLSHYNAKMVEDHNCLGVIRSFRKGWFAMHVAKNGGLILVVRSCRTGLDGLLYEHTRKKDGLSE